MPVLEGGHAYAISTSPNCESTVWWVHCAILFWDFLQMSFLIFFFFNVHILLCSELTPGNIWDYMLCRELNLSRQGPYPLRYLSSPSTDMFGLWHYLR